MVGSNGLRRGRGTIHEMHGETVRDAGAVKNAEVAGRASHVEGPPAARTARAARAARAARVAGTARAPAAVRDARPGRPPGVRARPRIKADRLRRRCRRCPRLVAHRERIAREKRRAAR